MSRRKHEEEEAEGIAEWMLTYSDLVTLLLTFFIMLFSMATVDKQKFEQVAKSLKSSFLNMSNGEMLKENSGKSIIPLLDQNNIENIDTKIINNNTGEEKEKKLDNVKEQVQKAIIEMNLTESVQIVEDKNEIILRFNSVLLFDLGDANIKPSGREALDKISILIKQLDNEIMVQGHTDDLPIETVLFPTNWELSTKRATNVVLYMVKSANLDPTKFTATGNGEFKPIVPNNSDANRQRNRRIDIVIVK